MLQTVAVRGYRSLREVIAPLGRLSIITGANGAGKSSVYRALRLLADCGRGEVIGSLAREGGLQSVLWAGPEQLAGARRSQKTEGTVRSRPLSLEMGFVADDFGYLVDLGMPQSAGPSVFVRDPEIKREVLFAGPVLRPSATLVRRSRAFAEAVNSGNGFDELSRSLPLYRSVLAEYANPHALPSSVRPGRRRAACRRPHSTGKTLNAHQHQRNSWSVKARVRPASLTAHKRRVSSAYARCTGRQLLRPSVRRPAYRGGSIGCGIQRQRA